MSNHVMTENENTGYYFVHAFDQITEMDCSVQYKIKMLNLLYGNIEGFKKQFDKKLKKWVLGLFKQQFIKFQKSYDFGYKIECFNEFIELFFTDDLPSKFQGKYEAYEKLMLEELEQMQMVNSYKLSNFTSIKKGLIDPDNYLLSDEYINIQQ